HSRTPAAAAPRKQTAHAAKVAARKEAGQIVGQQASMNIPPPAIASPCTHIRRTAHRCSCARCASRKARTSPPSGSRSADAWNEMRPSTDALCSNCEAQVFLLRHHAHQQLTGVVGLHLPPSQRQRLGLEVGGELRRTTEDDLARAELLCRARD